MAKKIETPTPAPESPYDVENGAKQPWLKTKNGKLTAAIVGGALILGGTFVAGVKVGEHRGEGPMSRFGFGNFGDDHRFGGPDDNGFNPRMNGQLPGGPNGQFQVPNGQLPMQPGQLAPSAAPSTGINP